MSFGKKHLPPPEVAFLSGIASKISHLDLSERTAQNYMSLFSHRDKTANLSDLSDAYRQIETIEAQEKMSREERDRSLIAEFRKTGIKPSGWTDKHDNHPHLCV